MSHLSNSEIQAFLRRGLPPPELLQVDDHLAGCSSCRIALEREAKAGPLVAQLQSAFRAAEPHLEYDQLRMMAEGEAVSPEVKRHAATCRACASELEDLRQFAAHLTAEPRSSVVETGIPTAPARKFFAWPVRTGLWGAIAATFLIGFLSWQMKRSAVHPLIANSPPAASTQSKPAAQAPPTSLASRAVAQLADLTLPAFQAPQLRGEGAEPHFDAGMRAYHGHDCPRVVKALTQVPAQDEDGLAAQFYVGVCQMHQGEPAAAAKTLREVAAAGDSPQQEAAYYYLGQIALAGNDIPTARFNLAHAFQLRGEYEARARAELVRLREAGGSTAH